MPESWMVRGGSSSFMLTAAMASSVGERFPLSTERRNELVVRAPSGSWARTEMMVVPS
jgi:hypothetical protein